MPETLSYWVHWKDQMGESKSMKHEKSKQPFSVEKDNCKDHEEEEKLQWISRRQLVRTGFYVKKPK